MDFETTEQLLSLEFYNNSLRNVLPSSLKELSLNLGGMHYTGTIRSSLSCFSQLKSLQLTTYFSDDKGLIDVLPTTLTNLSLNLRNSTNIFSNTCSGLSKFPDLIILKLRQVHIQGLETSLLLLTQLREFHLDSPDTTSSSLSNAISSLPSTLEILGLTQLNPQEGVITLIQSLPTGLKGLHLSNCPLKKNEIAALMNIVSTKLTDLSLIYNSLQDDSLEPLVLNLSKNLFNLTSLNLDQNFMSPEIAQILFQTMKSSISLQRLIFCESGLVPSLFDILEDNLTLQVFSVNSRKNQPQVEQQLANNRKRWVTLEKLAYPKFFLEHKN